MASTIDELQVLITAQTAQFNSELAKVQKEIKNLTKETERAGNGANSAFKKIGVGAVAMGNILAKAFTSVTSAISNSMGSAITRLDTLNNFPKVMSNLGIGTEDATRSIQLMNDKLQGLPTTIDAGAMAVQRFTSANKNIEASTQMFLALNNAILAGGAPMELQSTALEQISQAYTKSKFDAMEWRAMLSAMPAQLSQLTEALGYTSSAVGGDLYEALQSGKLSMNDFMRMIVQMNQKGLSGFQSFEEQARNSTGGVGTSIINLRTTIVRGIANIMDSIGQANIASFFNTIARAINAVIPYIIAFVRLLGSAIGFVGGLFGMGAKKGTVLGAVAEKTADSVKQVAKNAGGVGGALDSATGSAKKLQKQLAGFDEMNTLSEKDSGGSGGGAGGAGGGAGALDFGDMNFGDEELKKSGDKVQQILDSVRRAFDKLMKNPVVKGFVDVFKGIAGAVMWVWDKLSGVSLPQGIQDAFNRIGDFFKAIGQNAFVQELLYGLGIVIGVVVTAFAGWSVALGVWSVATTVATAVGTAFGAVIAMLTSPILLVVAGIGALIAIIVLLVKNWDSIKEVAGKVWDTIKELTGQFVTRITEFFGDLWEGITGFFAGIGKWFSDRFTEAYNGIVMAFKAYIMFWPNMFKILVDVFGKVKDWFGDRFSDAWNSIKNAFSGAGTFFGNLWSTITSKITDIGGKIGDAIGSAFKTAVNGVLGFLERTINGWVRIINGAINVINKIPGVSIPNVGEISLPRMATGGIVTGTTIAMIGEAGREAVLPLDRNTGWMDELAGKIGGSGRIELTVNLGEDTIAHKIIDNINDSSFMRNANVLNI